MKRKVLALVLACTMVFGLTACGNKATTTDPTQGGTQAATTAASQETTKAPENNTEAPTTDVPSETVVIRYGTHWVPELDPYYVDEVTGEYTMEESQRQAALAGLAAIKEELNVEFEFIQYSTDTRNALMTSVLAGNPICDIALMWGGSEGTILAQNVLQQLDDYAYLFEGEDSWMFYDKLYGHNYFLSNVIRYKQRWPLIFNITMLEQVDTLKDANGKTITPMDLYLEGNWTWSTFEDYLEKIQTYYANTESPEGCIYDTVQAYETDYRFAGLSAMYAAGGAIYGNNGLEVDSEQSLKGTSFITKLFEKKLLTDPGVYDDGYVPQWTRAAEDFQKGGTVFTDCPDWWIGGCASAAAERGESIGIVPWPREDSLAVDDPEYTQAITLGDSVGILKGVSPEKTELALKAYKLYWTTYYKAYGGVDSVAEYKTSNALNELAAMGIDLYSEDYGDKLIECFNAIGDSLVNDYADLLGIRVSWDNIIGKSLHGIDGMSAYDVAIKANMSDFTNVISNMEAILASDEVKDNMAPEISRPNDIYLPLGTDLTTVDWSQYFTGKDSVDGELDMTKATYTLNDKDFTVAGKVSGALKVEVSDKAGNKASNNHSIYLYNADNKEAPVITVKAELPTVKVDTDASTINWKDFLDSAVDVDGLDVTGNIAADLSELDTTTVGTYNVVITVTDFAGNEATATLEVNVVAE